MTEGDIFDRGRQKIVNVAFFIISLVVSSYGIYRYSINPAIDFSLLIEVSLIITGLFFISLVFGVLSKRAIDYISGEWEKSEKWVPVTEYIDLIEKQKKAYQGTLGSSDQCCALCCMFFILPFVNFAILIYGAFLQPIFSTFLDVLLLLMFSYIFICGIGFIIGYKGVSIDAELPFLEPDEGAVLKYMKALDSVRNVSAGFDVVIGNRANIKAILEAEGKAQIEGLPDSVALKLQVSSSGFDYPYLVGTMYKGPQVKDNEEKYSLGTRYPALFEYSMDGNVTVIVGRFDIPKKSSGMPSISESDFEALARFMATRMTEMYENA